MEIKSPPKQENDMVCQTISQIYFLLFHKGNESLINMEGVDQFPNNGVAAAHPKAIFHSLKIC